MCQQKRLRSTVVCLIIFIRKTTDSTIFTTRLYSNLLIEKSAWLYSLLDSSILVLCSKPSRNRFAWFDPNRFRFCKLNEKSARSVCDVQRRCRCSCRLWRYISVMPLPFDFLSFSKTELNLCTIATELFKWDVFGAGATLQRCLVTWHLASHCLHGLMICSQFCVGSLEVLNSLRNISTKDYSDDIDGNKLIFV